MLKSTATCLSGSNDAGIQENLRPQREQLSYWLFQQPFCLSINWFLRWGRWTKLLKLNISCWKIILHDSKLTIFVFWTVSCTKQDIVRHHIGSGDLQRAFFVTCWQSIDQTVHLEYNWFIYSGSNRESIIVKSSFNENCSQCKSEGIFSSSITNLVPFNSMGSGDVWTYKSQVSATFPWESPRKIK